jgi:hypothetical protein
MFRIFSKSSNKKQNDLQKHLHRSRPTVMTVFCLVYKVKTQHAKNLPVYFYTSRYYFTRVIYAVLHGPGHNMGPPGTPAFG